MFICLVTYWDWKYAGKIQRPVLCHVNDVLLDCDFLMRGMEIVYCHSIAVQQLQHFITKRWKNSFSSAVLSIIFKKMWSKVIPFSFWHVALWWLWCNWLDQDSPAPLGRTPDGVLMDCSVSLLVQTPAHATKPYFTIRFLHFVTMICFRLYFKPGTWRYGILKDSILSILSIAMAKFWDRILH
jgi:hypothetical protein